MTYENMVPGIFQARPNRFIAHVQIGGQTEIVHVKNTGRCRELLVPGARVYLSVSDNEKRKTQYDLIAVWKGKRLINMDSQSPNDAAEEYLRALYPEAEIKRECVHGDSRFDLRIRDGEGDLYVEVKGVTLEREGHLYFPDAPTERGRKHLHGLIRCVEEGHKAMVLFVGQMCDVTGFSPNEGTDPRFAEALREAQNKGVTVRCVWCRVTPDSMRIEGDVPVLLGAIRPKPRPGG